MSVSVWMNQAQVHSGSSFQSPSLATGVKQVVTSIILFNSSTAYNESSIVTLGQVGGQVYMKINLQSQQTAVIGGDDIKIVMTSDDDTRLAVSATAGSGTPVHLSYSYTEIQN